MRRISIVTMLLFVSFASFAQTEATENESREICFMEAAISSSPKQHGITPLQHDLLFGFQVTPRLSLMADWQSMLALYKGNEEKTYYVSDYALGGALGYMVYGRKGKDAIDLRVKATMTVGHAEWKYTQYEVGLVYYDYNRKKGPVIGLGYRFTDSRTKSLDNLSNIFVQVGLFI